MQQKVQTDEDSNNLSGYAYNVAYLRQSKGVRFLLFYRDKESGLYWLQDVTIKQPVQFMRRTEIYLP